MLSLVDCGLKVSKEIIFAIIVCVYFFAQKTSAEAQLSGAGWALGLNCNKSFSISLGNELLHATSIHDKFKYDILGFPYITFMQDPFNNNDINAAIPFVGLADFFIQYTTGHVNDFVGLAMAMVNGRIFWELNDIFALGIQNSVTPILFRPTKWWQETVGGYVQIQYKPKIKNENCTDCPSHNIRIGCQYGFNLIYPEIGSFDWGIQYSVSFWR